MQATTLLRHSLRRSIINNAQNNARFTLRQSQRVPLSYSRRGYSTESSGPSPSSEDAKSNKGLFIGLGVAALAGAGYYIYASSNPNAREAATAVKSGVQSAKALAHFTPSKEDYQKVYNRLAALLDDAGEYDGQFLVFMLRNCNGLRGV